jgi:[acyl-carrier-protein] S-malonyltransferase
MMSALAKVSPVIQATFAEAGAVLGYDLWQRCQDGPAELLNATECTQPAMLTAGVATYRLWRERGGSQPTLMAGTQPWRIQCLGGRRMSAIQGCGRSGALSG